MAGIWDAGFKDVMANLVARCPKPLKSTAVPTNKEVTVSIAVTPTPAPGSEGAEGAERARVCRIKRRRAGGKAGRRSVK